MFQLYNDYVSDCNSGAFSACDTVLAIDKALKDANLTEKQHRVFSLYYFDNFNSYEISEIIGSSRTAITRLLGRATDKVAEELRKGRDDIA